jgi:hypothetical protein
MHRTQISLEQDQYEKLLSESQRLGISLSEAIRRLIDAHFEGQPTETSPLDTITGIGVGSGDAVGREHNRYLYAEPES